MEILVREITFNQGLLITLIALVVGIDYWLEAFFIFRPIIVSTLVGIVLGDIKLGLIAGGLTELVFVGLTPVGGVQPPNPIMAGIMTPVLAYITGTDATTAIGLSLPFSLLMQYIILFYYSSFSIFMKNVSLEADKANMGYINKINIISTLIVALSYAVITFLSVYLAQDMMRELVNSMPAWLSNGLSIAGGILPAVGFGMLLKILLKLDNLAYFIIGFLLITFGSFANLLPVALVGLSLALINFFNIQNNNGASSKAKIMEDYSDGI